MLQDLHHHLQNTGLLPPRTKLLLAVSGGVDSVTLLHLLSQLGDYYNWQIGVAHLDHKVRSDSAEDAVMVGSLADEHGYKFYLGQLGSGDKREAELRQARYEFLREIAKAGGYDHIVTAHHGDDRIETSLLNAIRGADREGLTALKARRDGVVRPLLPFSKADIIVYANLQHLPYREDSTNTDPSYRRNFVRNELLPLGALHYQNFRRNFTTALDRLETLNERIDAGLAQLLEEITVEQTGQKVEFDAAKFAKLPQVVQLNLLSHVCKQLAPGANLSHKNLTEASHFATHSHIGATTHLSSGLHLLRGYATVIITSVAPASSTRRTSRTTTLKANRPFTHGLFRLELHSTPVATRAAQVHVQPANLYVRFWQPGDRVQPVGMTGSKKLQDVFTDAKVPRHLRAHWPVVVTAGNEVVWLPTLAVDRRFVANDSDQRYQLTCEVR